MTAEEMKRWIDKADYSQLLTKWRFARSGDLFFIGEVGDYYKEVMFRKRDELPSAEQVRISKEIGWKP